MSTMTREELPVMSAKAVKNAIDLDHYVLAAYDSIEAWNLKIVVVIPDIEAPTWVLAPRARKASRKSILALAVPSLEALTLEIAKTHTGMGTDYITLHTLDRVDRRAGRVAKGRPVQVPWTA